MKIGQGFDVHPLVAGRKLIIGGVPIAYHKGLDGHSDADVLLHAICDALLGAAGLGDIGLHFPDTDPKYKDADSMELLGEVCTFLEDHGWTIRHVDATVIMEKPKLGPHRDAIRHSLAERAGLPTRDVNIKFTTNERMGWIGRGEGAGAMAIATVERED